MHINTAWGHGRPPLKNYKPQAEQRPRILWGCR